MIVKLAEMTKYTLRKRVGIVLEDTSSKSAWAKQHFESDIDGRCHFYQCMVTNYLF